MRRPKYHSSYFYADKHRLKYLTESETFNAFPVFSNDGKKHILSSNRNTGGVPDTNLFVAEWQD